MTDSTTVEFILGLDAVDLEERERQQFSKQYLPELRQLDAVEQADRLEDVVTEVGAKGFATLVGWLKADVSVKNIAGFLTWMQGLSDKPVKVKVKWGDREVELESDKLGDPEATALRLIAALGAAASGQPGDAGV